MQGRYLKTLRFTLAPFIALLAILVCSTFRAIRQQNLNAALIAAVTKQDESRVTALLEAGSDANVRRNMQEVNNLADLIRVMFRHETSAEPESTVLMIASGQGNERIVSALLDHGANVNAKAHGLTPLLVAV